MRYFFGLILCLCFVFPAFAVDSSSMELAINRHDEQRVAKLLQSGFDVTSRFEYQRTALHLAAENGDEAIVRILLLAGADVDAEDYRQMTPLHLLAWHEKHAAIADLLIDHGASLEHTDYAGNTPFLLACSVNNFLIAKHLLARGVNLFAKNEHGDTALHTESTQGVRFSHRDALIQLLVAHGLSFEARNDSGLTPLMQAAITGNLERVKALVAHGSPLLTTNSEGLIAYQLALKHKHVALLRYLQP
jgi:ankyrin repeat protein